MAAENKKKTQEAGSVEQTAATNIIAEAEERAAAILEKARQRAEEIAMEATAKATEIMSEASAGAADRSNVSSPNNELVTIRLFKDNDKYKDDVFVAINGKSWLIQRGIDVQVPRKVAKVLERSMAQDTSTANLIERESGKFYEESKARGL